MPVDNRIGSNFGKPLHKHVYKHPRLEGGVLSPDWECECGDYYGKVGEGIWMLKVDTFTDEELDDNDE